MPAVAVIALTRTSFRIRTIDICYVMLALVCAPVLRAASACPTPRDVQPGTTLESLAASDLGGARYAIAIALATNARTRDGFRYIANPDDLTGISRVCVPSKAEARQLERSWTSYDRAVNLARLPRLSVA